MPRQTAEKQIIFPDGFKFSIDTGDGFEDVGLLSGGSTATFNYDEFDLDAGNYEDLLSYAKNPTVALAPSTIWNWNNSVIAKLMTGFAKVSNTTGGTNLEFNGTARHFTLTRANLKLTHFNGEVSKALVALLVLFRGLRRLTVLLKLRGCKRFMYRTRTLYLRKATSILMLPTFILS